MLLRLILTFAAALLALPALAQDAAPPTEIAGAWDLRIDERTIFRFEIAADEAGEWRGAWSRPQGFNSDGNSFYNIRGGVRRSDSMTGLAVGEAVELAFDDPRPGAVPDIFRFRLAGPDAVEMTYVGTGLAPFALVRATAGEALGNWDGGHVYRRQLAPAQPRPRGLVVPNLDFDLARPLAGARARPAAPATPVAEPGPATVTEGATEAPAGNAEPDSPDAAPAVGEAPPAASGPDEAEPRIGYDFLDGL